MVVELKAPKVKVGAKELTQVKEYARAVARDERFRDVTARWEFWLLANECDELAAAEARQTNRPRGLVFEQDDPPLRIWLKTWGQLIDENLARLRFVQKELDYEPDQADALERLKLQHAELFAAVHASEEGLETSDDDGSVAASEAEVATSEKT